MSALFLYYQNTGFSASLGAHALQEIEPSKLKIIENFRDIISLKDYINEEIEQHAPLPPPKLRIPYIVDNSEAIILTSDQHDRLRYENIRDMINNLEKEVKNFSDTKDSLIDGQKLLNPDMVIYCCSCCGERENLQPLNASLNNQHHPQVFYSFFLNSSRF